MPSHPTILGINAFHGDASAALVCGGQLAAAIEEERFNRIKHWAGLPVLASKACLSIGGQNVVDHVAVSRDPSAYLLRKVARVVSRPRLWRQAAGRAVNSARVKNVKSELMAGGVPGLESAQLHFVEHHRAHLASAFFASPFEDAAVVSVDGFGDFSSVMWGIGVQNKINVRGAVHYPHSLGILYTAFTQFLGFSNYGDEYKMMGLSAYGSPVFKKEVERLVKVDGDQVILDLSYFQHDTNGVEMSWANGSPVLGNVFSPRFIEAFGPARVPRSEITERDRNLAASVQAVLEDCYLALLRHVQKETGKRAVCLAGGVALNCVANGMVLSETGFRDMYIQPAAHDAGTSVGAALHVMNEVLGLPRTFEMKHVYFGSEYSDDEIQQVLDRGGLAYQRLSTEDLVRRTAQHIADGRIVGWYQGKMEFGPRALGNRSILADPRRKDMKDILNRRIKYREPFRPFCPSILAERTGEYFECSYPSPFMVVAYKIRPEVRDSVPAITHEDGTGRLQMVERNENPLYWQLIREFERITTVPVLINTSFNENEPIVEKIEHAVDCFQRTQMDVLAIGSFLLEKGPEQSQ